MKLNLKSKTLCLLDIFFCFFCFFLNAMALKLQDICFFLFYFPLNTYTEIFESKASYFVRLLHLIKMEAPFYTHIFKNQADTFCIFRKMNLRLGNMMI